MSLINSTRSNANTELLLDCCCVDPLLLIITLQNNGTAFLFLFFPDWRGIQHTPLTLTWQAYIEPKVEPKRSLHAFVTCGKGEGIGFKNNYYLEVQKYSNSNTLVKVVSP